VQWILNPASNKAAYLCRRRRSNRCTEFPWVMEGEKQGLGRVVYRMIMIT